MKTKPTDGCHGHKMLTLRRRWFLPCTCALRSPAATGGGALFCTARNPARATLEQWVRGWERMGGREDLVKSLSGENKKQMRVAARHRKRRLQARFLPFHFDNPPHHPPTRYQYQYLDSCSVCRCLELLNHRLQDTTRKTSPMLLDVLDRVPDA